MSTSHLPTYLPTWTSIEDLDGGPRFWIVYDSAEGFQPAYALVQALTDTDACDEASDITDRRINDYDSGTVTVWPVSANWAEGMLRQIPIEDQDDYLYELLDPDRDEA